MRGGHRRDRGRRCPRQRGVGDPKPLSRVRCGRRRRGHRCAPPESRRALLPRPRASQPTGAPQRTATTLIPSMYLADGRPRLVYGTMGGDGQPQTQAALVTRIVDRALGPQTAVEAPRWLFGRTWGEPSKTLRLEARFGPDVAASLRDRGHDVRLVEEWSDLMGHAQGITIDNDGLRGGSDPRADGVARGW